MNQTSDSSNQNQDQNNVQMLHNIQHYWQEITKLAANVQQNIRMDALRPLQIFLGISGPSLCFDPLAFNPPTKKFDKSTIEKLASRLKLNLSFFMTNYVLIIFGVTIVVALMYWDMLFALALIASGWWFHITTVKGQIPLVIMNFDLGNKVSENTRTMILVVFTFIVGVWFCLVPLFCILGISSMLILFHALMRDPNQIESTPGFAYIKDDHDLDESDSELSESVMIHRRDVV